MRPEAFSHADSSPVWLDAPDAPADEVAVSLPDGPAGEAAAVPDAELDALLVFRQDAEPVAATGEAGPLAVRGSAPPAWPPAVELGAGLVVPQVWPWDAALDVPRVWRWSAAWAAYSGLGAHSGLAAHWYGLPLLPDGRWCGFPALPRDVGLWDSGQLPAVLLAVLPDALPDSSRGGSGQQALPDGSASAWRYLASRLVVRCSVSCLVSYSALRCRFCRQRLVQEPPC